MTDGCDAGGGGCDSGGDVGAHDAGYVDHTLIFPETGPVRVSEPPICGYCGRPQDDHLGQSHVFDPVGGTPNGPRTVQEVADLEEEDDCDCDCCGWRPMDTVITLMFLFVASVFLLSEFRLHERSAQAAPVQPAPTQMASCPPTFLCLSTPTGEIMQLAPGESACSDGPRMWKLPAGQTCPKTEQ